MEKRKYKIPLVATEISEPALEIAKENASNLKVAGIDFQLTELINESDISDDSLILANLPYIPSKMYQSYQICIRI